MSNYIKATNFAAKDALPSGNAGKIVKGTEIDTEFNAIASAISSKADTNSPTLTGTPLAPTAASGTNTTQVATTAFVKTAVDALGTIGTIASQNANNVAITGGAISGATLAGTNLVITNTSSVTLASGTTAERPGSPVAGMFRMNTTLNMPEWYDATNGRWNLFSDLANTYALEYLIVGGGGSGGGQNQNGEGGEPTTPPGEGGASGNS